MKNLLKILGFIGSLAVGIATVNYLIQSSKSDASSALAVSASAQIANPSTQSKKLSKLAKIEQNYQPKAFEEIPVEYVQIATSDIDEGKKLPNIDASCVQPADKVVKVDQGSPFLSSRATQPNIPMESQEAQGVYPQDHYYPQSYDHGMDYAPRNNQIPHNDVDQSSQQPAQSQASYPAEFDKKPNQKKRHFRSMNDDLSSLNNTEYNPGMSPVKQKLQNPEQPVNPQMPEVQNDKGTKLDWKNLLNGVLNSVGSFVGYKALDYLFNKIKDKLTGQAESSLDGNKVNPVQVDASPAQANIFNTNPTSGCTVRYEPEQAAQSTSTESRTQSPQEEVQRKVYRAERRQGVSNTNVTPNELLRADDQKLKHVDFGQKTSAFASTRPNLMRPDVVPTEMIETNPVVTTEQKNIKSPTSRLGIKPDQETSLLPEMSNNQFLPVDQKNIQFIKQKTGISKSEQVIGLQEPINDFSPVAEKIKKIASPKGIVESISPEEVIELPAQPEVDLSSEGKANKKIDKVNLEEIAEAPTQPVVVQKAPSYMNQALNFISNQNPASLALGIGTAVATPLLVTALAPAALTTTAIMATTTAVAPVATAAGTSLVATSAVVTPSALAAFGVKAFIAVKTLAKFLPGPTGVVARLIP